MTYTCREMLVDRALLNVYCHSRAARAETASRRVYTAVRGRSLPMKSEFTAPINASRRENLVQPNLLIQILFRSPSIAKTSYPNFGLARRKSMCKSMGRLGTERLPRPHGGSQRAGWWRRPFLACAGGVPLGRRPRRRSSRPRAHAARLRGRHQHLPAAEALPRALSSAQGGRVPAISSRTRLPPRRQRLPPRRPSKRSRHRRQWPCRRWYSTSASLSRRERSRFALRCQAKTIAAGL